MDDKNFKKSIKTEYWLKRQKEWAGGKRNKLINASNIKIFDLINNIDNIENKIICEVGCGTGQYLGCIKKYKYLYGIDFMEDCVTISNKIKPKNCEIFLDDIVDLKFNKNIDIAYTITCLQHIHPTEIIKTIKNIMKLNPGLILIYEKDNTTFENLKKDETNYIWGHDYIELICSNIKEYRYNLVFRELAENKMNYVMAFEKE